MGIITSVCLLIVTMSFINISLLFQLIIFLIIFFVIIVVTLYMPLSVYLLFLMVLYVYHTCIVYTFLDGQLFTSLGMIKDFLYLYFVVIWLIRIFYKQYIIPWRTILFCTFFIFWNIVSALTLESSSYLASLYGMRLNIQFVILLPIIESLVKYESFLQTRAFTKNIFYLALSFATLSLLNGIFITNIDFLHYNRLSGLADLNSATNVYGVYISGFSILGIAILGIIKNPTEKKILFIGIIICIIYVFASYSRRAILGLGFGIMILDIYFNKNKYSSRLKTYLIVFTIGLLGIYYLFNNPIIKSIILRLKEISFSGIGSQERYGEWNNMLESMSIFDYLFGKGLGTFGSSAYKFIAGATPAHNYYIQLLVELGVFGIISYLVIIIYVIIIGMKGFRVSTDLDNKKIISGNIVMIIVFLIGGLAGTSNVSIPVSIMLWTSMGIIIGITNFEEMKRKNTLKKININ